MKQADDLTSTVRVSLINQNQLRKYYIADVSPLDPIQKKINQDALMNQRCDVKLRFSPARIVAVFSGKRCLAFFVIELKVISILKPEYI